MSIAHCGLSPLFNNVVVVHQAEARLASRRAARAEAREIRMRELERQQQEVGVVDGGGGGGSLVQPPYFI